MIGSCIIVECCASMALQKSDVLTLDERRTWDADTALYAPQAEDKALRVVAAMWNKRQS